MKKISSVVDEASNKNFNEIFNNLRLTDISPLGEDDYMWTAWPLATDKEKPFMRPCKVGSERRLYMFDVNTDDWHYISIT